MFKNWFKIYLHQTVKNKLFFFLNITGLAIGISALILAVLYWQDEHKYNAWNPYKDRVYEVTYQGDKDTDEAYVASADALGPKLMEFPELVEDYCYFSFEYITFFAESESHKGVIDKIVNTQDSFFEFFPFPFVYGNALLVFNGDDSIAISEEIAQKYFGNVNPVGKYLALAHQSYRIGGVYRLNNMASVMPNIVLNSIERETIIDSELWQNTNLGLLIKAQDDGSKRDLEKLTTNLIYENVLRENAQNEGVSIEEFMESIGGEFTAKFNSLNEVRLYAKASGLLEGTGNLEFVYIALSCALLILLLSIVNYINLTNAYVIRRVNELGIRKILGASNKQIIGQLVFETVINSMVAIVIALVFVELILPYFSLFINKSLSLNLLDFWQILVAIVGIVVILGGLVPALFIYRVTFLTIIKGKYARSERGIKLRNILLILQFAVAFFFVVSSLVIARQVDYMTSQDLGFKGSQVIQAKIYNHQTRRKFSETDDLAKRLCRVPGVERVGLGSIPFSNKNMPRGSLMMQGRRVDFDVAGVDFRYLALLGVKKSQGADLDKIVLDDSVDGVVVNRRFVEILGIKEPVDKEFVFKKKRYKIVTVVNDFFRTGFNAKIEPMALFDYRAIDNLVYGINEVSIKIESENSEQTLKNIKAFWQKEVDVEYPFHAVFLNKQFAENYKQYTKQRNLFRGLNLVVVFISLFGLFALVSFSIESRLKEIVIRKVLGAETSNLIRNLVTKYIFFSLIGFVIAVFPTYWLMSQWLNKFAYHTNLSWIPFAIAFIILVLLILAVVVVRAYSATKIDLLRFLKYE